MFTIEQIKTAHSKVKSGADFPSYIQDLKQLGVTSYDSYVSDGHTNYFGKNDFKIIESNHYTINEKGEKKYNLKLFIEEKIIQNEIGKNPLLQVNNSITKYSENTLLETLEKLEIKDIQIIPKQKSVSLFGKRGVDGMVKVLTR
mgnify:CR=1 FL=1